MPEMMRYTIVQTREVNVTSDNIVDAIRIAEAAFTNGQNSSYAVIDGPENVWGNANTKVAVTDIFARED